MGQCPSCLVRTCFGVNEAKVCNHCKRKQYIVHVYLSTTQSTDSTVEQEEQRCLSGRNTESLLANDNWSRTDQEDINYAQEVFAKRV